MNTLTPTSLPAPGSLPLRPPGEPAAEGGVGRGESGRIETDSLGAKDVPAGAYWGIHTARALENFPIADEAISVHGDLIVAYAAVKQAAARANREHGTLDEAKADLIERACAMVREGGLRDQFVVGVLQGGAGTSTNMNVNEVLANLALELGGHRKGEYEHLDPIDDVNQSQSTNDTYPTALRVALVSALDRLVAELELLAGSFAARAAGFHEVVKVARTQLQDAVPMTLGQEFHAFATSLRRSCRDLMLVRDGLLEVNLGGTAIGTGITAPAGYATTVVAHLARITELALRPATDPVEATSDAGAYVTVSATVKTCATRLSKICNDLRLLSSGPQAGFAEIALPPRQAGSSIMPGKVNPVVPEAVNQVAFAVIGCDATVTAAAEAGQLQLNAFVPVIAHSLLRALSWSADACRVLRLLCVDGITADAERLGRMVDSNVGSVTALTPAIGYAASAAIAKAALASRRSVAELVAEAGLLSSEDVAALLHGARPTGPHRTPGHPR